MEARMRANLLRIKGRLMSEGFPPAGRGLGMPGPARFVLQSRFEDSPSVSTSLRRACGWQAPEGYRGGAPAEGGVSRPNCRLARRGELTESLRQFRRLRDGIRHPRAAVTDVDLIESPHYQGHHYVGITTDPGSDSGSTTRANRRITANSGDGSWSHIKRLPTRRLPGPLQNRPMSGSDKTFLKRHFLRTDAADIRSSV